MTQFSGENRPKTFYIDTSVNNVPTTYNSTANSKVVTGLGGLGFRHMRVLNETLSRIAIVLTDSASAVPSNKNGSEFVFSAATTDWKDDLHIYDTCYLRSDSGSAITSGIITLEFT